MKVDAILCGDIHLREDQPICRSDNFWKTQWEKIKQLSNLQKKYDCPILCSGDLFHHWKPTPYLISKTLRRLPKQFYTVYGQHDLPQHNLKLRIKSGIHSIYSGRRLQVLPGCHWGQDPESFEYSFKIKNRKILVWHKFVWDGKRLPWPDCKEYSAEDMLDDFDQFDLILTGDHHKPIEFIKDGRLLVNPGCFTRQAADYKNHQPRVYLYDAANNTVKPFYLKIKSDIISSEHMKEVKERNDRIEAFVSRLSDEWDSTSSFEDNLRIFFSENITKKSIKDMVYKAIENENI